MRRENRRKDSGESNKSIFYVAGSIVAIGIIAFVITFVLYGNKMEEQTKAGQDRIADLVKQSAQDTQSASSSMGKTVEESRNEIEAVSVENKVGTNSVANNESSASNRSNSKLENNSTKSTNNTVKTNKTQTSKNTNTVKQDTSTKNNETQTNVEPKFIKPVDGEILKDFANEKLVYSNTLQEWTTHFGLDIKAEKTTVVKASEAGKVKSIKNDPRYGLSIIIEHQNGYETLYANLLTSEFVQVGEEVKQGQTIGTVGDTATFEIADEPHLHFEISKDGNAVDPNLYIK